MTTILALSILTNVGFFTALVLARFTRADLEREIDDRDIKIAGLNSENMDLSDAVRQYKGAWEATCPKDDEIYITQIVRKPVTLDEKITQLIRESGGC